MRKQTLVEYLERLQKGEISVQDVVRALGAPDFTDISYAKVDHHRSLRQGHGEVIYGAGKTLEQMLGITRQMLQNGEADILITRVDKATGEALCSELPGSVYDEPARLVLVNPSNEAGIGRVLVAAAGTSDIPVAREAEITARAMGANVSLLLDVGVAGLQRLLAHVDAIRSANVIVAAAGMEGALPSVIAGLVDVPVIAVPTSVGYGASFGGLAALLGMLNSCASGVSVVNIDNGFGAGALAARINRMAVEGGRA